MASIVIDMKMRPEVQAVRSPAETTEFDMLICCYRSYEAALLRAKTKMSAFEEKPHIFQQRIHVKAK